MAADLVHRNQAPRGRETLQVPTVTFGQSWHHPFFKGDSNAVVKIILL
jgi:hypothetical protein